jgi:hypothetical protein
MAVNKAWLVGPDAVCSWYEEMAEDNSPYYSVWEGKYLRFSYGRDDVAAGSEILRRNMESGKNAGSSDAMILKLHDVPLPKGTGITDKTPYSGSVVFRCCGIEDDATAVYNLSGLGAIERRLKALEGVGEDKEMKEGGVMGMLNGILMNPQVGPVVAQAAIGAVFGIINKFLPGVLPSPGGQPGPAPTMAGIPNPPIPATPVNSQEKNFDWAMDTLEAACPDIEQDLIKFAELSQKNPELFKMVIQQLRALP